eukprot:3124614-Amphidinium_carterae.1
MLTIGEMKRKASGGSRHTANLTRLASLTADIAVQAASQDCAGTPPETAEIPPKTKEFLTFLELFIDRLTASQAQDETKLTCLIVHDWQKIGADGCKHLRRLRHLRSLTIGDWNVIGSDGCEQFVQLTNLTSLTIGDRIDERNPPPQKK